jgi:general secretion pathway protein L
MKRQVLGLDINEEYVAAVVIASGGNDRVVTAAALAKLDHRVTLAEVLPPLLEKVGWKDGASVCGISLSGVSLRNFTIPFTEKRKIAQILHLELEDQLLVPVRDQIIEYILAGVDGNKSHLLVTGIAKDRLKDDLEVLKGSGLNPHVITLRTFILAEQFVRVGGQGENFLLIDTGMHEMNMVIVRHGRIAFMRRLVYPDRVFTDLPFYFGDNGIEIVHHDEAMECIASLCDDIKQTLGLYQLESRAETFPEQIVMFGPMVGVAEFREKIEAEFDQPVLIGDLPEHSGVSWTAETRKAWRPGLFDHAIALALQGLTKKISINFRKDEFVQQGLFFASRTNQIVAVALLVLVLVGINAYLGYDYRILNARYNELGDRMTDLFKETFPEATRIVDPLVQMKTGLRNVQAPSIATPVFSGDKRSLNILADISQRVPETVEIHVSRLVIDKESVMVKGTTKNFNDVNLIQGMLRKSPAYDGVDIISASAEKDTGLIRFELKLQTAGAS